MRFTRVRSALGNEEVSTPAPAAVAGAQGAWEPRLVAK
jgi:hypothetical protein